MGTPVALDRVTSLALDPGAEVVVAGVVTTSIDGSTFEAPVMFDLDGGGLHVVQAREGHAFVLAPSGHPGTGCAAAGISSPCFVPRISELAHARLEMRGELAATLSGGIVLEGVVVPPPPPAPDPKPAIALGGTVAIVLVAAWLAFAVLRQRARSAIGRVRTAAREALRATRGDPTLDRVREEVSAMLGRAVDLESARRACKARLARIDRTALDRKRDAHARVASPDAADALAWMTAEQAEVERLESDHASSLLGLARLESALRVVAMRVREHRGTRARVARHDPADEAAAELRLRDEALEEADRATAS
ncbi:MAG TPA: hypothetical protein VGG39_07010 [Polyangiaceae bacterium]|jgi:hypothetical protein